MQKLLLDKLGIPGLLSVIGGSIGGMQVLQWAIDYPDFVKAAIPIATTSHLGAQSIAFDAVGRNAILGDANFAGGQYHNGPVPSRGLSIARMIGHITYLSEEGMREKFGRQLRGADGYKYEFDPEFSVETYLDYKGQAFVERFDANSYLYITKAGDYFDLGKDYGGLENAFAGTKCRFMVVSFSSDWLFTPEQSELIVNALVANRKDVSYCNIESTYGHDAFLLESNILGDFLANFIDSTYKPELSDKDSLEEEKQCDNAVEMAKHPRVDYEVIEGLIKKAGRVLDVGCGNGELLCRLRADKGIYGECLEVDSGQVRTCVKRGLPTIQYDVERGLTSYADKSFDAVILSQTLQTLSDPESVLRESLRVGRKVIVSFPNFAHWRCRLSLMLKGRAPVTRELPFGWYNSPNRHFGSLKDFNEFCEMLGAKIEKFIPLIEYRRSPVKFLPNLLAEQAVYLLRQD